MVTIDPNIKLQELKKRDKLLQEKLKQKRLLLGSADGAMQSRYPSGRFELEDEIQILEIRLAQIKEEIKLLEKK